MPKNKVQDAVFTAIMAIIMVYGMIVYNVALNHWRCFRRDLSACPA